MIDKLNLSDEHKKLLEIYKNRNLMEELNFSAYYPTGKQDKQTEGYYKWLCLSAYMKIKELELPQGEWIRIDAEKVKCPFCEVIHLMYAYPRTTANFCPSCGADMRKPNCVTCDHFGKCEGCEKGDEE